jgi:hypothetical protein
MITQMRGALRTVLVVSDRPHPWAFIRDRLDPALATVAWARPAGVSVALTRATPWTVAGAGAEPAPDLTRLGGRLVHYLWVGPAPEGLPARPATFPDWQSVASDLERSLAVCLGGCRLAPSRGLLLPNGGFVSHVAELEALLGAHPDGIEMDRRRLRVAARRVAAQLERHRLPLCVHCSGSRLMLAAAEGFADGSAA